MKTWNVALIGLGSVGRGVAEVLAGDGRFRIVAAADSKSGVIDPAGLNIEEVLAKKKKTGRCGDTAWPAARIAAEAEYDILVEVTPTNADTGEPALSIIKTAIKRGKHVVTSNKGPVSLASSELLRLAEENNVGFLFEGTVAGAVPILRGI